MLAILLVDDEPMIRLPLGEALSESGHDVTLASDGAEAIACIDAQPFDLVVSDVRLPKADGFAIRKHLRANAPDTDLVLMSAYGTIEEAIAGMKRAAPEYVSKPFDVEELVVLVNGIDARRRSARERDDARQRLAAHDGSALLVGTSDGMAKVRARIAALAGAASKRPILVAGERGTGKAMAARLVHAASTRGEEPFLRVRCKRASDRALEGAFARRDEPSQRAIYLEDVEALTTVSQAALVSILASDSRPRFIASTSLDLSALVADGRFRDDLARAFSDTEIVLPPLRARTDDIPLLADHFARMAVRPGVAWPTFSAGAMAALLRHAFPGNVRELSLAVTHGVVLSRGRPIEVSHLPKPFGARP